MPESFDRPVRAACRYLRSVNQERFFGYFDIEFKDDMRALVLYVMMEIPRLTM